jgi:hypothetical protein
MESDQIKVKISYLVVGVEKMREKMRFYMLLDNDLVVPHAIMDRLDKSPEEYLRSLHDEYVEYSFDFLTKDLASVRFVENICEIVYLVNVNYVPRMNKKGRLFTLEELEEREIEIEDYYGRQVIKFIPSVFRATSLPSNLDR